MKEEISGISGFHAPGRSPAALWTTSLTEVSRGYPPSACLELLLLQTTSDMLAFSEETVISLKKKKKAVQS